eukprot:1541786-Pyramimonas_sp.AAC.1
MGGLGFWGGAMRAGGGELGGDDAALLGGGGAGAGQLPGKGGVSRPRLGCWGCSAIEGGPEDVRFGCPGGAP